MPRFPVSVTFDSGALGRRACAYGLARSYSAQGLRVRTDTPLTEGTRVAVRFNLPDALAEAETGLRCEFEGTVAQCRATAEDEGLPSLAAMPYDAWVRWDRDPATIVRRHLPSRRRKAFVGLTILLLLMLWYKWVNFHFFWYYPFLHSYSIIIGFFFLSRFVISRLNRLPGPTDYEPTVTVVVAVRNEEAYIGRTIDGCFNTLYPPEKREVIVVNDGSTDGTPRILERMKEKYPELRVHTLPPSGKRLAMATGVWDARGEIVVFVDSDTFLHPLSLREIVCGFEDPTLGASAGHTDVENADVNTLTRMQEIRYAVGYKLMKAAESTFSCVSCCPGCLSAYRRSYLIPVLDDWLNQMFLGSKATFGDDRSLTNRILKNYRIIYNDRALCTTLVPDNWTQFMRQQVRWKKSWLRETMIAACFIVRKHPVGALSFIASALCSTLSPFVFYRAVYLGFTDPNAQFSTYLLGFITVGMAQCLYFVFNNPTHRNWLIGMWMMVIQIAITGPQTYYAMITMRKNHWGTR
ncbi:MAG: glycosyltransferase [Elusimicrobia bacterium]|nr:glycosyltransferase [Elusimicrobiota bacterium]